MPYSDSNSRPPSPEPAPAPPPNSPRDGVTRLAKAFCDGGGPIGDTGVLCLEDLFCIRETMDTEDPSAQYKHNLERGYNHCPNASWEHPEATSLLGFPVLSFTRYERGKKHSVPLCCVRLSPSDI
ncbi:hypothetical protein FJTKL_04513 [Diaporthe vaccinii]|uniref:Uncharacterized protein n=1 Tax=Diaporthe vaccinii TaxID=105482 RepID=A0ABR4DT38_9PEZI